MISIDKVTPADIEDLVFLLKGYYDFYEHPHPPIENIRHLITTIMNNQSIGIQFIAKYEGEPSGFATLYKTYSTMRTGPILVLNDLYVNPNHRGRKIGKKLFQRCVEYMNKNNFKNMEWITAKDNIKAQKLYDSMGGRSSQWINYSLK